MSSTERTLTAVIAVALSVMAVITRIGNILLLIPYSNWTGMMLFSHEGVMLPGTQQMTFFNSYYAHSFFPLTYVLTRVLFLFVPSPLLVEFILFTILGLVLMILLARTWMHNQPPLYRPFIIFAIGAFSLFFLLAMNQYFWFNDVGLWELIVFFTLLGGLRGSNSGIKLVLPGMLLTAMILGDDGLSFLIAAAFLGLQILYDVKDRRELLSLLGISTLAFISYQVAIGFVSVFWYGRNISSLLTQIYDILTIAGQNFAQHLNAGGLPLYQSFGEDFAFVVLFVCIPMILLFDGLRAGMTFRDVAAPGVVLFAGLAFRGSYVIFGQGSTWGAFFILILYLALPASVLGVVRKKTMTKDQTVQTGEGGHARLVAVLVLVCVLSFSILVSLPSSGTIASAADPRVAYGYLPQIGIYTQLHASSPTIVEYPPDLSALFLFGYGPNPNYLVGSVLPSTYFPPIATSHNVYYSNGLLIIADS